MKNEHHSLLLRLPTELREIMYQYTFQHGEVTVLPMSSKSGATDRNPMALRQICRQLRHEIFHHFFKYAIFDFSLYGLLVGEWRDLGAQTHGVIRSIRFGQTMTRDLDELANRDEETQKSFIDNQCAFVPWSLKHVKVIPDVGAGFRYRRRPWVSMDKQTDMIRRFFGKQEIEFCGYRYELAEVGFGETCRGETWSQNQLEPELYMQKYDSKHKVPDEAFEGLL
jgi:hypothetical protein